MQAADVEYEYLCPHCHEVMNEYDVRANRCYACGDLGKYRPALKRHKKGTPLVSERITARDYWVNEGMKTYSPKPQYSRMEIVFTCPICGHQLRFSSYLNLWFFERACKNHLDDHELE